MVHEPTNTFLLLQLARLILTTTPGYVHPDEHFQSIEPAGHLVGLFAYLPWEFTVASPIRSWLPVVLAAFPIRLLKIPNTILLLVAARLPYCAVSFVQDAALARICRRHALPTHWILLLHASAWPTLVFGARTFSNTLEASLFAVSLAVVLEPPSTSRRRCVLLGALLAIGTWVRFTFVLFWLPLGLHFASTASSSPHGIATLIFTAATLSVLLLAFDCAFYGGACITSPWLCIAPLNAGVYNASPTNLANHGINHRLTHLLINLPLLLGPLAFYAYSDLLLHLRQSFFRDSKTTTRRFLLPIRTSQLLLSTTLVPLLALSIMPHQEPRFLLPLITPLLLLYGTAITQTRRRMAGWFIYHLALAAFFSLVHQSGVVRALAHLQQAHAAPASSPSATAVFFHTYMPSRVLLAMPRNATAPPPVSIIDLGHTASVAELSREIIAQHRRSKALYVILPASFAPALRAAQQQQQHLFRRSRAVTRVARFWPHWTGEDPPWTIEDAALEMYRVGR